MLKIIMTIILISIKNRSQQMKLNLDVLKLTLMKQNGHRDMDVLVMWNQVKMKKMKNI